MLSQWAVQQYKTQFFGPLAPFVGKIHFLSQKRGIILNPHKTPSILPTTFENTSSGKQDVLKLSALVERTREAERFKVFVATASISGMHTAQVLCLIHTHRQGQNSPG